MNGRDLIDVELFVESDDDQDDDRYLLEFLEGEEQRNTPTNGDQMNDRTDRKDTP